MTVPSQEEGREDHRFERHSPPVPYQKPARRGAFLFGIAQNRPF